jgi:hypothetical protein
MIRMFVRNLFIALLMAPMLSMGAERVQIVASTTPQAVRGSKPIRAIGVNYYNGFMRVLRNPEDRSYRDGFRVLKERKIPFVRFVLMGFFPTDMSMYMRDRQRFYALLDEFVAEAEKNGVGLVPSLFFAYWQVPDQMGEPMQAWGNPTSKSNVFMREFMTELLVRYRYSSVIWGWEFSNEMSYYVDLDAKARPRVNPGQGTPTIRTGLDDLRANDMVVPMRNFASLAQQLDPGRLSSGGNAMPRADAYQTSNRTGQSKDSRDEFFTVLKRDNPTPLNSISVHLYPHTRYFRGEPAGNDVRQLLTITRGVAESQKQIVFVGEFGVPTRTNVVEADEKKMFADMLQGIIDAGVPLAAIWDFDPDPEFDKEWNIYSPRRRYQLDAVEAANRRLSNGP